MTPAKCTTWRCLIGFGAGAINPYLAFESVEDLISEDMHGLGNMDPVKAVRNYIKACGKGVLKVMSKMGVSTVASYTGAQIFEAIGLGADVVEQYFTGTVSQLGGIGLSEIAAEVAARHRMANPTRPEERAHRRLELGGEYQWRREGEPHLFNPDTVYKLQHSTRAKRYDIFKEYTASVDDQSRKLMTLRGLFEFNVRSAVVADRGGRADRVDHRPLLDRCHELRLDLDGGARDAGDRDEPDRWQVEHRRGRRGRRAVCTTRVAGRRSSRSRRDDSG